MHICTYICMYVCMYTYKHTQRDLKKNQREWQPFNLKHENCQQQARQPDLFHQLSKVFFAFLFTINASL